MKTTRPYELKERIYQLCNKEQYFTAGSNEQYTMMFYAATSGQFSARDVAVMIGICSICGDIGKIERQITEIMKEIEKEEREDESERIPEPVEF